MAVSFIGVLSLKSDNTMIILVLICLYQGGECTS